LNYIRIIEVPFGTSFILQHFNFDCKYKPYIKCLIIISLS